MKLSELLDLSQKGFEHAKLVVHSAHGDVEKDVEAVSVRIDTSGSVTVVIHEAGRDDPITETESRNIAWKELIQTNSKLRYDLNKSTEKCLELEGKVESLRTTT